MKKKKQEKIAVETMKCQNQTVSFYTDLALSQVTMYLIHTFISSRPSFAQFRMHLDAASTLFRRIWSIDKTKLRTLRKALTHLKSTPK